MSGLETNSKHTRLRPPDLETKTENINTKPRSRRDGDRKKSALRGFITANS